MGAPASGTVGIPSFCQRREKLDGPHQQPAEPHAFTLAAFADPVHAVVPVTGADERQAMIPEKVEALVEAAGAVLEQRARAVRDHRLEEGLGLAGMQNRAFAKRHGLAQTPTVPGTPDKRNGTSGRTTR